MANAPGICCIIDVRSSGILMDYVHAHEPCAPGSVANARRRMFQYNSILSQREGCRGGGVPLVRDPRTSGCCSSGIPYNGSGSIFSERYGRSSPCSHLYGGYQYDTPYRGPLGGGLLGGKGQRTVLGQEYPVEEEEDYSKFDRARDWVTCFGSMVIVACIIGLIHSYAVFAPAIQHHYGTGLVETVLVGCLSYFALLITIPIAACLNQFLEHRWTAIFGMVMFFIGLILDSLTWHPVTLYISHILLMGCGGACAYMAAISIVSDHFRRHLVYALCAITCSGSIGTIIFYLLSNLMLSYVSYMWTKLCLALIILICMGACQTFPKRAANHPWLTDMTKNAKLKECVKEAAKDREAKLGTNCQEDAPRKSCLCICVCDISVWTDISFLLWAIISFIAIMTLFLPYLFLVAYAYTVGADYAVGLVCWFCVASIVTRFAVMNSNDHTFGFNRTVFQVCCVGSGVLYIFLNWAETYGWILVWGLAIGAIEGIVCVVIPRVTLQCIPLKWLSSSWRCIGLIHAFSVIVGPMIMMSVYYNTLEYGPALIAIGVAQIIAGILAFLLPNEEANELEDLENSELRRMGPYTKTYGEPGLGTDQYRGAYNSSYGDGLYPTLGSYAATGGGYSSRYTTTGSFGNYDSTASGSKGLGSSSYKRSSLETTNFLRRSAIPMECFSRPYTDKCPICSQVGCIPGYCGCTPGDLSKSFVVPSPALMSNKYGGSFSGQSSIGKYNNTNNFGTSSSRPKPISMEEVEQFLSKFQNNNRTLASQSPYNSTNQMSTPPQSQTMPETSNTQMDSSRNSRPLTPISKSREPNKVSPSLDKDLKPKNKHKSKSPPSSSTNKKAKLYDSMRLKNRSLQQRSDKKPVKSK